MVSVATAQFCHCSRKAAIDNLEINGSGCVSIKLYKNRCLDHHLLTPTLEEQNFMGEDCKAGVFYP